MRSSGDSIASNTTSETDYEGWDYRPIYHGRTFSPQLLYKTIIYSYTWTYIVWRKQHEAASTEFLPANMYGLQIRLKPAPGVQYGMGAISWFLGVIVHDMQQNDRFQPVTADVLYAGALFAIITVRTEDPRAVSALPNSAGINETNEAYPNISTTTNGTLILPSGSPKMQRDIAALGTTSNTFHDSVICRIQQVPAGFVVRNIEPVLMGTLINFARLATDHGMMTDIEVHDPSDEIVVVGRPTGARSTVQADELLICLIDIIQWEYERLQHIHLFQQVIVQIERLGRGLPQPVAVLQVRMPPN